LHVAVTPILDGFASSLHSDSDGCFSLHLSQEYSGAIILLTGATGGLTLGLSMPRPAAKV
jgi:hypothetical protein